MPRTSPEKLIRDLLQNLIQRIEADVARGVAKGLRRTALPELLGEPSPPPPLAEPEELEIKAKSKDLCSVEGCDNPRRARGLCSKHYQQQRYAEKKKREGRDGPRITDKRGGKTCSVEGCDRPNYAKGMCGKHFMEWVRSKKAADEEKKE